MPGGVLMAFDGTLMHAHMQLRGRCIMHFGWLGMRVMSSDQELEEISFRILLRFTSRIEVWPLG